jgi:hypothetical protein
MSLYQPIVFPHVAEIVPPGVSGNVRIEHFEVSQKDAEWTQLRAAVNRRGDEFVPAGKYAKLIVDGSIMMSDTPMEQRTNRQAIRKATGHVIIAGLGLGMILHPMASKPEVTKITVIELSSDVIKLVAPYLPSKVEVVQADIFEYRPEKGTKFNTVYFDIWPSISGDNLEEMSKLHRRWAHYKTKEAWMNSWCRDELLEQKARRRRHSNPWDRALGVR